MVQLFCMSARRQPDSCETALAIVRVGRAGGFIEVGVQRQSEEKIEWDSERESLAAHAQIRQARCKGPW